MHQISNAHTRVLCVTGPLGAGKTTTLMRLHLPQDTQLVINEIGELQVDVDRLTEQFGSELDIASLVAGCLGCDNASGFDTIVTETVEKGCKLLIVEPTGVADAREIKAITDRHNLPWSCLTLINPQTFRRNRVEGLLQTQLSVATAVAITRPEKLTDELEAEILSYAAHYASGAPVYYISSNGKLDFMLDDLLLTDRPIDEYGHYEPHVHNEHCDHEHGSHGYVSMVIRLQEGATLERLLAAMEPQRDTLVRAKGIIGRCSFDVVGPEATIGKPTMGEPYAVLIASEPINLWFFAGIMDQRALLNDSKKQLIIDGHDQLADVLAAIDYNASTYPDPQGRDGLPILGPDNDIAVYLSRRNDVPQAYRMIALQARMCHLIKCTNVLRDAERNGCYADRLDRLSQDCLELGAALAWNAQNKSDLLGVDLVAEIATYRPAHLAIRGLGSLVSLNLHLLPLDSQGPTTPYAIKSIVAFGTINEDLVMHVVLNAMYHALKLADGYPVWQERWQEAIESVG